jgi:hypothetical protein
MSTYIVYLADHLGLKMSEVNTLWKVDLFASLCKNMEPQLLS